MRKLISLLLAFAMVVTMFTVPTFAASANRVNAIPSSPESADVADADVMVIGKLNQLPTIQVSMNGEVLEAGFDYTTSKTEADVVAGTQEVTIIGIGQFTGKKTVEYKVSPVITGSAFELAIGATKAAATVEGTNVVSYVSSNPEVATVAEDGTVTAVAVGTTTVTVKATSEDGTTKASKAIVVTVTDAPVTVDRTPIFDVVTVTFAGQQVPYGTTAVTGAVTVTGVPEGLSAEITKVSGDSCLSVDNSGVISVAAGTVPGTYSLKVKVYVRGNKEYAGGSVSRTVYVKVLRAAVGTEVNVEFTPKTYDKAGVKSFSPVKVTGLPEGCAVGYHKESGDDCLTINQKTGVVTVAAGTKPGIYTIKIRVHIKGNDCYAGGNRIKTVKIYID